MGRVACELADRVILTSDNPRTEDPAAIIRDIQSGTGGKEWRTIPDRKAAIETALASAGEADAVLIAGKGHEDYQIIGDATIDFSDTDTAREFLSERVHS